jgi:hypothetical protein
MPITTYAYNKQVNPITLRESIENDPTIVIGINNIQINSDNTSVSAIMKDVLPTPQEAVLSGLVDSHIYSDLLTDDEHTFDRDGKLIVHQSIRPPGMSTYFTGAGDDPSDMDDVGNGEHLHVHHNVGDPLTGVIYGDFNIAGNKSFIYEGYISWDGVKLTELTVSIVSHATTFNMVSGGTGFDLYGGYLIIPSANGTLDVTADLGDPHAGLVYMPLTNDGTRPQAFWDATYNPDTKRYENIVPNYTGEGEYNLFAGEIPLTKFVNRYILTGSCSQELDSEDAEEIGQGMIMKIEWEQDPGVVDTDYIIGCTLTMHREKTV